MHVLHTGCPVPTLQSARDTCSMASILSLPDELIERIGTAAEKRAGFKAWCRLTSTCRRLWGLQLPQARRGWSLPYRTDIEGKLHRRQLSPTQLLYHRSRCCSIILGKDNHIDCVGFVQGWPGCCSACKQHPGFISLCLTWAPTRTSKLRYFRWNLSTACNSMWRQPQQHRESSTILDCW